MSNFQFVISNIEIDLDLENITYPVYNNNNSFSDLLTSYESYESDKIIITISWSNYTNLSPLDGIIFNDSINYYKHDSIVIITPINEVSAIFNYEQITKMGYSACQLKSSGYTSNDLIQAGYTFTELIDACYSIDELKEAGFDGFEKKSFGYSASEMKDMGYTVSELRFVGYTASEMKVAEYTASEMKKGGYTVCQLKNGGYTAIEMKAAEYTAYQLKHGGYTQEEIIEAGYIESEYNPIYRIQGHVFHGYINTADGIVIDLVNNNVVAGFITDCHGGWCINIPQDDLPDLYKISILPGGIDNITKKVIKTTFSSIFSKSETDISSITIINISPITTIKSLIIENNLIPDVSFDIINDTVINILGIGEPDIGEKYIEKDYIDENNILFFKTAVTLNIINDILAIIINTLDETISYDRVFYSIVETIYTSTTQINFNDPDVINLIITNIINIFDTIIIDNAKLIINNVLNSIDIVNGSFTEIVIDCVKTSVSINEYINDNTDLTIPIDNTDLTNDINERKSNIVINTDDIFKICEIVCTDIASTIIDNNITFKEVVYNGTDFIDVCVGIYTITGVPKDSPIGFVIKDENLFIVKSATDIHRIQSVYGEIITYSGDVVFEVKEDFGDISCFSKNGDFFEGFKKIIFSSTSIRRYNIDFVFNAFSSQTVLGVSATLFDNIYVEEQLDDIDAISVFYISQTDINNIFKFKIDSDDINDVLATDLHHYIFMNYWPNTVELNPVNGMMDQLSSRNKIIDTGVGNKMLVKHDFLRYLSKKLFNTPYGVDLFNNESDLIAEMNRLGSTARDVIFNALNRYSTDSTHMQVGFDRDINELRYTTGDISTNDNLCYVLLKSLIAQKPGRFADVAIGEDGLSSLPIFVNDTINFKFSISPAAGQETLTGLTIPIPKRSYQIKLIIDNGSNNNTIPLD